MVLEDIARIAYEAERAYAKTLNDWTYAPWEWATNEVRGGYINAVAELLEASHAPVQQRTLTHEKNQKLIDNMFGSIVLTLSNFLE